MAGFDQNDSSSPFSQLNRLTQTMNQEGYQNAKWSIASNDQSQSSDGFSITLTGTDRNGSDLNRTFTAEDASPQSVSSVIDEMTQEFSRQAELAG